MNLKGEPSLNTIDDYSGTESAEKSRTIKLVILGLLVVGAIYTGAKFMFSDVSDYIGTTEAPGINTAKGN